MFLVGAREPGHALEDLYARVIVDVDCVRVIFAAKREVNCKYKGD